MQIRRTRQVREVRGGLDIERMHTVFVTRERRVRKQVIEDRNRLNEVLEGLRGADDIKCALRSRLHQPAANRVSVAALAEAQDHARVLVQQIQEVVRLKALAEARSEQMRTDLAQRRQQWKKAQYRVTHAQALRETGRLAGLVRQGESEDEDAGDQWLTQHRALKKVAHEHP